MGQSGDIAREILVEKAKPDAEVLEALRRGDRRAALSVLMRDYAAVVRRFCADLVADSALADDVAQTTFVNAFESLATFAGQGSCKAWLLGIARHRCLDVLKNRRRWFRIVSAEDELPEIADQKASAEADLSLHASARAISECLQSLPARMREAVGLRYRQNLAYDEMAEMMRERAGTLRVRVARALPLLRRCLEARGVEP
jgi:RNA polymerase sigma-70 factor (ECF subfamily)